ncbi:hypothetical protein NC661_12500 [Aquibacillus koreensis]|uniref:Uncharacterized protein n=1 Tax=Aquibacillus koreensis TaxID=279446 RepID=A0A9X3WN18_9BACI|nr:hypothetical protein [Aquibacillus koreensis]MCT2537776.1 hypothetical protein [Aquibacillus koreensis]MDC3421191.1 hypothetical protein [Aquibacillus koreensis]
MSRYYHDCKNNIGRPVKIVTRDGKVHRGMIERVNNTHVFLKPMSSNLGGYGYGFYRPWGFGAGLGWGVALGSIATLAFLPFFFW